MINWTTWTYLALAKWILCSLYGGRHLRRCAQIFCLSRIAKPKTLARSAHLERFAAGGADSDLSGAVKEIRSRLSAEAIQ
jgi:hypothetical protein